MSAKYNEYISKKLETHHDELVKQGFSPVYIALVGSQNYGIDTEDSDVDTKAIVLPTLRAVAANERPVSQTVHFDNGEQCDVKDIREMVSCWKKQNVNFLEVLFTEYYMVHKMYARFFKLLRDRREDIAHYDPLRAIMSSGAQGINKCKAIEHISPASEEKINKYGYDPKQLCHAIRMREYCQRYIEGCSFADCINPIDKKYLIYVKQGNLLPTIAREIAKITKEHMEELMYYAKTFFSSKKNEEVDKFMTDIVYQMLEYYFISGVI